LETELKFQVPTERSRALRLAVATAAARTTHLQAVYCDTPDRRLAAAGLALRLRREDSVWVQTLKGRGDGLARRQEHELRVASDAAAMPTLDPLRHAGSAVGAALLAVLANAGPLQPVYRTDIQRLHRRVRSGGAVIEIAHDQGEIVAGERRLAVDEIEFELISGPPAALPALAARWAARHGLWWDVRTKSEQGHRLALGLAGLPPVKAATPALEPATAPAAGWRALLQAALAQALANAAEIAGGSGTPEHLHQLRVGLRRLRSVLRVYPGWGGDATAALALEADWRAPFAELGAARDADVLALSLRQRLAEAGAPAFDWPQAAVAAAPADLLRGPAFTALALRTLALVAAAAPAAVVGATDAPPLAVAAREALQPLWRRVRRDARAFAQADAEARHRLRKRLKRLRYALEPLGALLRPRRAARWHALLAAALDTLGELNDLQVADAALRRQAVLAPGAWFALGHVAAQREALLARAAKQLAALADRPLPWRKP